MLTQLAAAMLPLNICDSLSTWIKWIKWLIVTVSGGWNVFEAWCWMVFTGDWSANIKEHPVKVSAGHTSHRPKGACVSDPLVGLTRPDSESRVQASALKTMFMDAVSNGNRFDINHVLRKHPALSVRT